MIANNINKVLKSTSDNTRLAFPSIIQRLCDEAGVEKIIDEVLVEQDKPNNKKKKRQRSIELMLMCSHNN